jgi:hypothetical protein
MNWLSKLFRTLCGITYLERLILQREKIIMAAIDDLNAITAKLATDVAALIASDNSTAINAAIAADVVQLTTLDNQVIAATPAPPAPPAP